VCASRTTAAERALGRPLRPGQVEAYWYRRTLDDIRAHPGRFAALLARKLSLFWNAYELLSTYDYHFTRRLNPVLGAPLIQFRLLAPFALLGTLLLFTRRRDRLALLCALFNLTACASVVLFFVLGHYRMAALPDLTPSSTGSGPTASPNATATPPPKAKPHRTFKRSAPRPTPLCATALPALRPFRQLPNDERQSVVESGLRRSLMTLTVSPALTSTEKVSLMLNCGFVSVMRCDPDGSFISVCGVCRPVSLPSTLMLVHGFEPSRR
jgi:hypothetical protein